MVYPFINSDKLELMIGQSVAVDGKVNSIDEQAKSFNIQTLDNKIIKIANYDETDTGRIHLSDQDNHHLLGR